MGNPIESCVSVPVSVRRDTIFSLLEFTHALRFYCLRGEIVTVFQTKEGKQKEKGVEGEGLECGMWEMWDVGDGGLGMRDEYVYHLSG